MKRIAILLNGGILHDARVIKVIRSLSTNYLVDLYYEDPRDGDEELFGVEVKLFPYSTNNGLYRKILDHSFFYRKYNHYIKAVINSGVRYDLVYVNDLPTLYPGFILRKKLNIPLIYDSHEIYVETLNQFFPIHEKNFLKRQLFYWNLQLLKYLGSRVEKKYINHCHYVLTVNESLVNYFKKKYGVQRIEYILNAPGNTSTPEAVVDYRKMFNWRKNDRVVYHQGNFTHGKGLILLVKSFQCLPERFKLVFVGGGPLNPELENIVSKLALNERVKFIGKVPQQELQQYTMGADIGTNFLEAINLSKKLASNNKMFEYIHANVPVLSSITVENEKVHDQFDIGLLTSLKPREIADNLKKMDDELLLEQYAHGCRKAALELNWEEQEKKLLKVIDATINAG